MTCGKCGSEKLPPSMLKKRASSRRCNYCVNHSPAGKARRLRWMLKWWKTDAGRAKQERTIRYGHRTWGVAKTPEQARAIEAVIKEMILGFRQRQSERAKDAAAVAGAVAIEAGVGTCGL